MNDYKEYKINYKKKAFDHSGDPEYVSTVLEPPGSLEPRMECELTDYIIEKND